MGLSLDPYFMLTQRQPRDGPNINTVDVGMLWTGHHKTDRLPAEIVFGALVELRVMPDEADRDVEVSLHYSLPDVDAQDFAEVPRACRRVHVLNPLEVPDSIYCRLEAEMTVEEEGALFMWVALDGEIVRSSFRPIVINRG